MPARDKVLALALAKGIVRSRDLDPLGIARSVLARLVADGALLRIGRGAYMHHDAEVSEHHTLAEVAVRVPGAVVNLLSALVFHGLTVEQPHAVWVAMRRGRHAPRIDYPRLELTWTASRYLELGVSEHRIEGVVVAITEPARTVADCFKLRRRVGLDVAVHALRDYLRENRAGWEPLWEMAGVCGVRTVLRPHLETLS